MIIRDRRRRAPRSGHWPSLASLRRTEDVRTHELPELRLPLLGEDRRPASGVKPIVRMRGYSGAVGAGYGWRTRRGRYARESRRVSVRKFGRVRREANMAETALNTLAPITEFCACERPSDGWVGEWRCDPPTRCLYCGQRVAGEPALWLAPARALRSTAAISPPAVYLG